jgi:hypothetical protein
MSDRSESNGGSQLVFADGVAKDDPESARPRPREL